MSSFVTRLGATPFSFLPDLRYEPIPGKVLWQGEELPVECANRASEGINGGHGAQSVNDQSSSCR